MFSLDCFDDEGKVLSFDGKQDQSNVRCELRAGSTSFCFVEIPMYGYDPVSIWNVLRHQLLRIVVGIISLPIVESQKFLIAISWPIDTLRLYQLFPLPSLRIIALPYSLYPKVSEGSSW